MQQTSLKSVKAKLLKRSIQGNRRKFNRSCSMSSKEYEMTITPMKGDIVNALTMSPHLSHFGSLCLHFFAWGLFPPSASRVLFAWHARSAEEFTPPPLGEALNQWPMGVSINTLALSPLEKLWEACSTGPSRAHWCIRRWLPSLPRLTSPLVYR